MTALEQKFESLLFRLDQAIAQVDGGKLGNYEELNREIMVVCNETQSAEPAIAKAMQPQIGRVILKLDELANSITTYKENLEAKKQ